jgi:hypothetical protein
VCQRAAKCSPPSPESDAWLLILQSEGIGC